MLELADAVDTVRGENDSATLAAALRLLPPEHTMLAHADEAGERDRRFRCVRHLPFRTRAGATFGSPTEASSNVLNVSAIVLKSSRVAATLSGAVAASAR